MSKQSNNTKTEFEQYCDAQGLSEDQIKAITCQDKRVLVLAGAGAGKTKTLIEHIKYLHSKYAEANKILVFTFTKSAVEEIKTRLKDNCLNDKWVDNVRINTFHSFAYNFLKKNNEDSLFTILTDKYHKVEDEGINHKNRDCIELLRNSLCDVVDNGLINKNELMFYIIDNADFTVVPKGNVNYHENKRKYLTKLKEKVYSKSEMLIADWFKDHDIKYEYEKQLQLPNGVTIKPDFYLPKYDLYIEHFSNKSFGDRNTRIKYYKDLNLKFAKTEEEKFISYKYLNDTLTTALIKEGVTFYEPQDWDLQSEFGGYIKSLDNFLFEVKKASEIIDIEKITEQEIEEKIDKLEEGKERVKQFYKYAFPIIKKYKKICKHNSYIDFNGLVIKTTDILKERGKASCDFCKYDYILVDEFQDVDKPQVEMLRALIDENTHLFCVGDDWQSIYGFRGSDPQYIVNFEKTFPGIKPTIIKLKYNFRSNKGIVDLSNYVIGQNKNKTNRDFLALDDKPVGEIKLYIGKCTSYNDDSYIENSKCKVDWCKKIIDDLYAQKKVKDSSEILFLFRKSFQSNIYKDEIGNKATLKTIHSSKGLEAKYVFIIGLDGDENLFPDLRTADLIFKILKPENYVEKLEEERRVFYVALTRAKEGLYLIATKDNMSEFAYNIYDYWGEHKDIVTLEEYAGD